MPDSPPQDRLTYLDFDLEIGPGQGREYPVAVLRSPAGEARETMRFPFDELQLESRLKDIQIALLLPVEARRRAPTVEEQVVERFGRELFDALMAGEIRSAYDVSWRRAEARGKGLRVKLRVQSPALASLPWEFLYDPREGEYLCLMSDRPVVRYIETAQPVQPLSVTPPLRILGMIASPSGLPELNVEQEKLRLAKATEALQARGLVELVWLEGQTWRDLQRAMRGGPWHIFHFVGHGGFAPVRDEGLIVVADDAGQPHYLTATDLSRLLADHKPLRLVLLNACEGARGGKQDIFSSTASILVRRGVPAVAAMQYPVTDRAAVEFARSFYESLADGLPADAAVAEARKAISIAVAGTAEWGTPVLFMRASDGRIFDITRTPQRAAPVPTPPPAKSPAPAVPQVAQVNAPATELSALRAVVPPQPAPQPVDVSVADTSLPEPVTPARPHWLWPTVAGVIGLVAIAVGVWIAISAGIGKSTPSLGIGSTMVSEKDGMTLVYVPAGEFLMGSADSDSNAATNEKPRQKVTLDAYWIDQTEVTNAMFATFVATSGHRTDADRTGKTWTFNTTSKQWEETAGANWQHPRDPGSDLTGLDQHPVVQVSWNDAAAYCAWAERRLPTEAEWEKAARGPLTGSGNGREFPWGNEPVASDRLNFADRNLDVNWADKSIDDGYQFTAPVGSYPRGGSPYEVLDMAGNVWEWVADWYDEKYYADSPVQNPMGPDTGQLRVLRGGSWFGSQWNARTAGRGWGGPDDRNGNLSFRCARSD